jgi:hypothetical protein
MTIPELLALAMGQSFRVLFMLDSLEDSNMLTASPLQHAAPSQVCHLAPLSQLRLPTSLNHKNLFIADILGPTPSN